MNMPSRKLCIILVCITLIMITIIAIMMPKIQITLVVHTDSGVTNEQLNKPKAFYLKEWKPKINDVNNNYNDKKMQQLKPKSSVNSMKPYRTFSEKRKFKQEINQRIVSIITGGFMIYFIQNISKIVLFLDEQGRNDNVTLKSCSSFIMYNRVNKCGSTTLQSLIDIVGKLFLRTGLKQEVTII